MDAAMSEKQLQAAIIESAELHGWLVYHTHDSRRSQAGFPDLVMVLEGEMLAWELKSQGGTVSRAQSEWLRQLGMIRGCDARVVRPRDLEWCHERLKQAPEPF